MQPHKEHKVTTLLDANDKEPDYDLIPGQEIGEGPRTIQVWLTCNIEPKLIQATITIAAIANISYLSQLGPRQTRKS